MSYTRYTHNPENIEFCSPCYLCKHPDERPKRNKYKCSMDECDYLKCYEKLAELEDIIEDAEKVIIYAFVPAELWDEEQYKAKYTKILYDLVGMAKAMWYIDGLDPELICTAIRNKNEEIIE